MTRICTTCHAHFNHDKYIVRDNLIYCLDCGNIPGGITFLRDIVYTPACIADIGAGVGESTRAYAKAFPNAELHAFDPKVLQNKGKVYQVRLGSMSLGDEIIRLDSLAISCDYLHIDVGNSAPSIIMGCANLKTIKAVFVVCHIDNVHKIDINLRYQGFRRFGLYDVQTHNDFNLSMGYIREKS